MIAEVIREYLVELKGLDQHDAPSDDASLLEQGLIDSLNMMELVTFIESRFGIQVSDDELMPSNFETIGAMERFVSSKRSKT